MATYENTDQSGTVSIDLDPDDGEGPHVYAVHYWIGIRTPESTAAIAAECVGTDSLGFDAVSQIPSTLGGSTPGSAQGVFSFDYPGVALVPAAVFRFDIAVFGATGTFRYDYKIVVDYVA